MDHNNNAELNALIARLVLSTTLVITYAQIRKRHVRRMRRELDRAFASLRVNLDTIARTDEELLTELQFNSIVRNMD